MSYEKIGVIGGGFIGGVLVHELAVRQLVKYVGFSDPAPFEDPNASEERNEVLRKQSIAGGKVLDISEGLPIIGSDVKFSWSKDYSALQGCDMVLNTAGVPRKARPDGTFPSRAELLTTNLRISRMVARGIKQYCPDAVVINVANPLDAIVYTLDKELDPPKHKLMGMAGALDSTRYRYFVAEAAGVSVQDVEALVLGGHGPSMVPVRSSCRIKGLPVTQFLDEETLAAIEQRTRKAGGEVVGLLGIGSAFVSTAWSALEMAEAIVRDKKRIVACSAYLDGQYGLEGLYVGVPCLLGSKGIEKVLEIDLTDEELEGLQASAAKVRGVCDEADKLLANL